MKPIYRLVFIERELLFAYFFQRGNCPHIVQFLVPYWVAINLTLCSQIQNKQKSQYNYFCLFLIWVQSVRLSCLLSMEPKTEISGGSFLVATLKYLSKVKTHSGRYVEDELEYLKIEYFNFLGFNGCKVCVPLNEAILPNRSWNYC